MSLAFLLFLGSLFETGSKYFVLLWHWPILMEYFKIMTIYGGIHIFQLIYHSHRSNNFKQNHLKPNHKENLTTFDNIYNEATWKEKKLQRCFAHDILF